LRPAGSPPSTLRPPRGRAVSIFNVGMWNNLRLVLLTLGVVVALYALFLALRPPEINSLASEERTVPVGDALPIRRRPGTPQLPGVSHDN